MTPSPSRDKETNKQKRQPLPSQTQINDLKTKPDQIINKSSIANHLLVLCRREKNRAKRNMTCFYLSSPPVV